MTDTTDDTSSPPDDDPVELHRNAHRGDPFTTTDDDVDDAKTIHRNFTRLY